MVPGRHLIIGVTGIPGCGKSVVADMFASMGAEKIDADRIGHELLDDSGIKEKVADIFGTGVLDGDRIDRCELGEKVFSDTRKLKKLNELMHPVMIRRIKEAIDRIRSERIVVDAPLLFEAGIEDMMDTVIAVKAAPGTCVERMMKKGITRRRAERMIGVQMPLSEKLARADHIIDNSGNLDKTKKGVESIWQRI